jgi:hypothetical protein
VLGFTTIKVILSNGIGVTGRPHAGIEPPHVVRYDWNEYPGGVGYAKSFAGGANIYEKEIVEFLKWFW